MDNLIKEILLIILVFVVVIIILWFNFCFMLKFIKINNDF